MTTYLVFRRLDNLSFELLGAHECNGPEQAIRHLAGGTPGWYAATPRRNWTEVSAEVEQRDPKFVLRSGLKVGPDVHPGQTAIGDEQGGEDVAA